MCVYLQSYILHHCTWDAAGLISFINKLFSQSVHCFLCFWKRSLLFTKAAFIWLKYYRIWIFSIITPVFRVTWSFRNHSNILICFSKNISDYYQCWNQLCCLIFLWKLWFQDSLMNWKFRRTAFVWNINIFSIINVLTVTFDQFNDPCWIKV